MPFVNRESPSLHGVERELPPGQTQRQSRATARRSSRQQGEASAGCPSMARQVLQQAFRHLTGLGFYSVILKKQV